MSHGRRDMEKERKSEDAGIGRKHCRGEERGVEERRLLEWGSGTGCEIRVTRVMILNRQARVRLR